MSTILILTLNGISSVSAESKSSSLGEQILDFIQGDEKKPELNATLIESYSKAIRKREKEIEKLNSILYERDRELNKLRSRRKECFPRSSSCLPFGNSSGTYEIYAPGMDDPFKVRCSAGWIVIQQRFNGKEDFRRNWTEYREGFDSFDEDFFLGLEKIHRLTSSHRHELQINMKDIYGTHIYAVYDQFEVSGEDDQYRLFSLGNCTGNEYGRKDYLREHEHQKFYTYDRDVPGYHCAQSHLVGGWWFAKVCGRSNLNGEYYSGSLHWGQPVDLKKVVMLIRPKIET